MSLTKRLTSSAIFIHCFCLSSLCELEAFVEQFYVHQRSPTLLSNFPPSWFGSCFLAAFQSGHMQSLPFDLLFPRTFRGQIVPRLLHWGAVLNVVPPRGLLLS